MRIGACMQGRKLNTVQRKQDGAGTVQRGKINTAEVGKQSENKGEGLEPSPETPNEEGSGWRKKSVLRGSV